ncbi:hypothetical protein F383_22974 [Gossypium arboreum]|uniref:Uncharacterized protein n=1 Tax=Gossypium arboreum TaxID=29729 RepID=A0A0B0NWU5_GOSAR|nr:hypothetical protein F383_22974 [Gossypium arboreum]
MKGHVVWSARNFQKLLAALRSQETLGFSCLFLPLWAFWATLV